MHKRDRCPALPLRCPPQTGELLAAQCDRLVAARAGGGAARLREVVQRSRCVKGRLLHYFPTDGEASPATPPTADGACGGGDAPPAAGGGAEAPSFSSWCGWHRDHSTLTGLTCAMYCAGEGPTLREVPNPDPASGLYIRAADGSVVRARFGADCVAFQLGEAAQIHTAGLLRATPHCVRAAAGAAAAGVGRNTFAVFLQPNYDEAMDTPPGLVAPDGRAIGVPQWQPGCDFGEFALATVKAHAVDS